MKPKRRTHKHRKNRQRRTLLMRFSDLDRPLKVLILVELTLTVLLVTLLLLRHSLPSALPVRLTFAAAVCLPILFFSLHRKRKPSPVGQVLNILSAVKLTAAALLTIPRLFALGTALLLVIHAAYLLRLLLRQDQSEALLLQLLLCLLEAIMPDNGPTCRSLDQPLVGADLSTFQFYLIDGFIVSNNVQVNLLETDDRGFICADHNPVRLQVTLMP